MTAGARWLVATTIMTLVATQGVVARAEDGTLPLERLAGEDRIATAIAVSAAVHDSSTTAVLARADDFADALAAAPLAHALVAPLLLTSSDQLDARVADELERLGVSEVVLLGGETAISDDVEEELAHGYDVRRVEGDDRYRTAAAVALELEAPSGAVVVSSTSFADALSAAPLAAQLGWPLLLTSAEQLTSVTRRTLEQLEPEVVFVIGGSTVVGDAVVEELGGLAPRVERLHGADRYATSIAVHREALQHGLDARTLWLATGRDFPDALAAGPAVAAEGASLLLVDGSDLRHVPDIARHLRDLVDDGTTEAFVLSGGPAAITDHAPWQLDVVLRGAELPRGGFTLFPTFRMVAFYGHHTSPRLGVLGEQPPDAAYERLWQQAQPYEAGGRPLLPTFELIVSVAMSGPGPDGDYSAPSSPEQIQPWLDAARRHGVYLLLDIQPGRSDFLSEVRRYEAFLREPDVGVALDPEWRMDADEVPAESVGEVHASEVNAVADYLAAIVREEHLPQKLLVVHQFQTRMVEDKHLVGHPPELAVLFHMDGHGGRQQKRNTYSHVSDATGRWWNGWKLFYDEDVQMYTPHELLAEVRPVPDFISYQ